MRKTVDLPHLCKRQMMWTTIKGSSLPGNLLEKPAPSSKYSTGYHLTGTWGLMRKQKCAERPCLVCGTADADKAAPKDQMMLGEAKEKHEKTRHKKLKQ